MAAKRRELFLGGDKAGMTTEKHACCPIMVMVSIPMMNITLMAMPVVTMPLPTCYLLFATTAQNFHFAQLLIHSRAPPMS